MICICSDCGGDMNRWRHIPHPPISEYAIGQRVRVIACGEANVGRVVTIRRIYRDMVVHDSPTPGKFYHTQVFAIRPEDYSGPACNARRGTAPKGIDWFKVMAAEASIMGSAKYRGPRGGFAEPMAHFAEGGEEP